jgi:uncharacterized phage-associated protein
MGNKIVPYGGENMPFQSEAVANKFVEIAGAKGVEMTLMKLLKLVYFAHGWHLALTDSQPLIDEYIQAWKFGPVAPHVYYAFKDKGSEAITKPCMIFDPAVANFLEAELITPRVPDSWNSFFVKIWDIYGGLSAFQLSQMTHQEGTPWQKVWSSGGSERRGAVIPDEEIRKYFLSKVRKPAEASKANA